MRKIAIAATAASLLAWAATAGAAGPIKVGIPLPLTGPEAKFGEIEKRSYEFAVGEINAAGGVKGMKLELDIQDSQGKPEVSRAIAEKFIDVQKYPFILGDYSSSCSKAVAAVAEERKIPYLVVTGAADDITKQNYKYVFRLNPSSSYYNSGLWGFLREVVKPKSVAILYESSDFGSSGSKAMEKEAKAAGIEVLMNEKYEKGAVDFKPILSSLKAKRPDMIYMVSYVMDASLLMRQIKELRIDAKLFAGGAAGFAIPEFIDNAKDASEDVVTSTLWSANVPFKGAKEFAKKYKDKYGDFPSYHGAEAYSALYVIADALKRAKSSSVPTPDAIREALKATKMDTAFGSVQFEDRDGYQNQNFQETLVMQVIKGEHQTIWPKKFASAPYVFPIPAWRDRR
ncbi:MAG: ABC transporter substrate-binding protein [Deltaproteobacteria bacterium]|nr:ABC transporter substrate-binding protein [Deltaproteobacteria bacterium]